MPRYSLRLATLEDLDVLVAHRRRMWEDMGGHTKSELDRADGPYRRWARARLRSGKLFGFLVESKAGIVASGCVWRQPVQPRPSWPGPDQPYLLSMYTAPEHRGRGLATRIVKAVTARVRNEGYPRFTLHASDQGRGVYAKLGFVPTGEMALKLV